MVCEITNTLKATIILIHTIWIHGQANIRKQSCWMFVFCVWSTASLWLTEINKKKTATDNRNKKHKFKEYAYNILSIGVEFVSFSVYAFVCVYVSLSIDDESSRHLSLFIEWRTSTYVRRYTKVSCCIECDQENCLCFFFCAFLIYLYLYNIMVSGLFNVHQKRSYFFFNSYSQHLTKKGDTTQAFFIYILRTKLDFF